jgi:hypothetical protein
MFERRSQMRITLDIDADVLAAARERARREHKTTGQLVSDLLRRALTQPAQGVSESAACYGFEPFASRGTAVSEELIARLRDDEGT